MLRLAATLLALSLALPLAAQAQEADQDNVLSVSSWICPQAEVDGISENYQTYTQPVERELIEEGMLVNTGMFFHFWGDEWNVNYFRIAPTMEGLMEAVVEVGRRVNERNPELAEEPNPFAACTAHKDNLYFIPPSTAETMEGG